MKNYLLFLLVGLANQLGFAQSNAPTGLTGTAPAYNRVVLTWKDNSTTETRFEIERNNFASFTKIGEVSANVTTYTDNSIGGGTYRIRAVFATGATALSNEFTINTPPEPPGTPTGLSVTAQNSTSSKLTWNNGSGSAPTDYRIERGTTSGGTFTLLQTVAYSRAPTFTDGGLSGGQQYCYRVRSQSGSVVSDFTAPVCTTPPLAPTNVKNLQANALSSSDIKLTWDRYGKESGIGIERRTGQSGDWRQVATTLADGGEFTDNNLSSNIEYCYRLSESGHDYSSIACAVTQQSAPRAPARLTATAVSSSQINLSWADLSDNEANFELQRADSPSAPFTTIQTVGPNVTTFSDQGLRASNPYCYRVRAVNSVGASDYTDSQCATTQAPPVGAPQNLVATATATTQINLTWTGVTGATGYQLERSPNGNDGWDKVADPVGNAVSYDDPGLTPDTRYFYRIRAVINGPTGPFSNVANAITPDVPPAAPARLTATAISYNQINLTWADLSGNESGFELERSTSATGTFEKIASLPANTTSYEDKNLTDNRPYCYRVRATNAAGPSAYTDAACATTPLAPPANPTNLTAQVSDYDQIQLNWSALGNTAVTVSIERSKDPTSGFVEIKQQPATQTGYVDIGLQEFTTYYYRIRAVNTAGNSGYSTIASARIEEVIIAVEDELATHTTLYMNQRDLQVITNWYSSMRATVQVMTATGQPVLTDVRKVNPADAWQYALDRLPTGIYIIAIVADGRSLTKRIVIP